VRHPSSNTHCHSLQDLPNLQATLCKAIAKLEREFPPPLMTGQLHLLHHWVDQIERFGPLRDNWMFPFEGLIGILKGDSCTCKQLRSMSLL
jgi:hypothetical protein